MNVKELEDQIGYSFTFKELCLQACTHKSYQTEFSFHENFDNELLEFLGDAVLDLVIGDMLMMRFPNDDEGKLSKKRASLVNEFTLSEIVRELKIETYLRMGRGEKNSKGHENRRLQSSLLEALIGAVYRDGGYHKAYYFVDRLFKNNWFSFTEQDYESDYKTRYQELAQKHYHLTPTYVVFDQIGPPHERTFFVRTKIDDKTIAEGSGLSKKEAEQAAAKIALDQLEKEFIEIEAEGNTDE